MNVVPLNGYRATADVWASGQAEPAPERRPEAHYRMVGPAYFRTFGVPVIQGRAVDDHDTAQSEPVVLVNRTLARACWGDRSPLGEYLILRDDRDATIRRARVVGLAGEVKHFGLETESTPDVYVPIAQVPEGTIAWLLNNMYWGVRTSVDPDSLRDGLRRELRAVDPDVPASMMRTMDEVMALATAPRLLNLWLVRLFGLAAVVLAAAGIYSVTAFSVCARTREIGIRAALGATPADNIGVLLADAGKPIVWGLLAGAVMFLAVTPALRAVMFGVRWPSALPIAAVAIVLLAVGLGAALAAAARLRSIDPIVALRAD